MSYSSPPKSKGTKSPRFIKSEEGQQPTALNTSTTSACVTEEDINGIVGLLQELLTVEILPTIWHNVLRYLIASTQESSLVQQSDNNRVHSSGDRSRWKTWRRTAVHFILLEFCHHVLSMSQKSPSESSLLTDDRQRVDWQGWLRSEIPYLVEALEALRKNPHHLRHYDESHDEVDHVDVFEDEDIYHFRGCDGADSRRWHLFDDIDHDTVLGPIVKRADLTLLLCTLLVTLGGDIVHRPLSTSYGDLLFADFISCQNWLVLQQDALIILAGYQYLHTVSTYLCQEIASVSSKLQYLNTRERIQAVLWYLLRHLVTDYSALEALVREFPSTHGESTEKYLVECLWYPCLNIPSLPLHNEEEKVVESVVNVVKRTPKKLCISSLRDLLLQRQQPQQQLVSSASSQPQPTDVYHPSLVLHRLWRCWFETLHHHDKPIAMDESPLKDHGSDRGMSDVAVGCYLLTRDLWSLYDHHLHATSSRTGVKDENSGDLPGPDRNAIRVSLDEEDDEELMQSPAKRKLSEGSIDMDNKRKKSDSADSTFSPVFPIFFLSSSSKAAAVHEVSSQCSSDSLVAAELYLDMLLYDWLPGFLRLHMLSVHNDSAPFVEVVSSRHLVEHQAVPFLVIQILHTLHAWLLCNIPPAQRSSLALLQYGHQVLLLDFVLPGLLKVVDCLATDDQQGDCAVDDNDVESSTMDTDTPFGGEICPPKKGKSPSDAQRVLQQRRDQVVHLVAITVGISRLATLLDSVIHQQHAIARRRLRELQECLDQVFAIVEALDDSELGRSLQANLEEETAFAVEILDSGNFLWAGDRLFHQCHFRSLENILQRQPTPTTTTTASEGHVTSAVASVNSVKYLGDFLHQWMTDTVPGFLRRQHLILRQQPVTTETMRYASAVPASVDALTSATNSIDQSAFEEGDPGRKSRDDVNGGMDRAEDSPHHYASSMDTSRNLRGSSTPAPDSAPHNVSSSRGTSMAQVDVGESSPSTSEKAGGGSEEVDWFSEQDLQQLWMYCQLPTTTTVTISMNGLMQTDTPSPSASSVLTPSR